MSHPPELCRRAARRSTAHIATACHIDARPCRSYHYIISALGDYAGMQPCVGLGTSLIHSVTHVLERVLERALDRDWIMCVAPENVQLSG